ARHRVQHGHQLHHRRLQRAEQARVQLRLAGQRRKLGHFGRLHRAPLHHRRLDLERRRRLGERRQRLGERDRIGLGVGDRRRALEILLERLERAALERAPGDGVLDDLVLRLRGAKLAPQLGDLGHVHALVVDQHGAVGSLEGRFQLLELGFLVGSCDGHQCFTNTSMMCVVSMRTPGPIVDDIVTLLRYLPLAADGFALTMLSTSAWTLAISESAANDTLPTGAWMMPVLSTRNSTLPALISRTAFAMSTVTVPVFGFGIRPRGPSTLPSLPTARI